ncbi:MAG: beta-ketoacyl-ACP synthase II [Chloroflexi bacterium]|nr:beta-ketoacyl-ACP synthase II [Chloroflexota bacterium]
MKESRPQRRRVVVTGLGAVSPLGLTADELWEGLVAGKSGIAPITLCDTTGLPCTIAGEVKGFDPRQYLDFKEAKRMARFSQFAVVATQMALENSGLKLEQEDPDRRGVLLGNGYGGFPETEENCRTLVARGGMKINPFFMPMILPNMAAGQVSMRFRLRGYSSTVITACAAATQAIGEAAEVIRRGSADIMVTGGTEAGITALGIAGFAIMRALTTQNQEPAKASRPFDANRDGFVPAEGSGILILEELGHAQRRGARILAELVGFGVSSDAHHITAPDADGLGARHAMEWALADAGLRREEVDYINAHGTSTPLNDATETLAIKSLFGEYAYKLAISSTKSMVGHLMGASGGVGAIATIRAITDGVIHPTINYETPDPQCDLDYVPNQARRQDVRVALSNSFGFGGQNACLAFKKFAG